MTGQKIIGKKKVYLFLILVVMITLVPIVQASVFTDLWDDVLEFFGIIKITNANHLNSERETISNIYDEVKELDDIWSEIIPSEHYVRVTFEQELDNTKDITIYSRVVSGTPRIEVYEIDGIEIIAEFTNIISNQYNKVYLTNLQATQDVFDLLILDGNLEFDYIVDPTTDLTVTECGDEGDGVCDKTKIETDETDQSNYETLDKNEIWVINYTDLSCSSLTNVTVFLDIWAQDVPSGETVTLTCSVDGTTYDKCGTNTWVPAATETRYSYPATGITCSNINDFRMKLVSNDGGGPDDFYLDYTYVYVNYTEAGDTDPPLWFDNSTNGTQAGTLIEHRVRWTDVGLSGYIFEFDNGTGTFNNGSFVSMIGTQNWSNVTKYVNETAESTIRWRIYVNDTASPTNWNSTDIFTYDTIAGDSCTYVSGNWNINCADNCTITSNVNLGGNNISIIGTGTFITTANISNFVNLFIQGTDSNNICKVTCRDGGGFKS